MPTRDIKYWKRTSKHVYEPHSTSLKERAAVMHRRDNEAFCPVCKVVVEPDGKLDAIGITDICPFCNTEV